MPVDFSGADGTGPLLFDHGWCGVRGRRIFISYRRADAPGHAGRVYDALRASLPEDDEVFMDVVALTPGVDFREAVSEFLETCDVFLAVIGPAWERADRKRGEEDYVTTEIEMALRSSVQVIIPVLVGGASMPSKLPFSVRSLAHKHAVELSDLRWSYDIDRLLRAVRQVEPRPGRPTPAPGAPREPGGTAPTSVTAAQHGQHDAPSGDVALRTGDAFTLVLSSGAARQPQLQAELLDWLRSQELETEQWVADGKAYLSGRAPMSGLRRWAGLDSGLIASFSRQGPDGLEVRVFPPPLATKSARAGIAVVFVLFFPLMALPLYGAYRQAALLRKCQAFLERSARWVQPR